MTEEDDVRLLFMPENEILSSSGNCDVMRDVWFCVHPTKGLVFYKRGTNRTLRCASPQCNRDERVTRMFVEKMYPWAEAKFFPMVIVPISVD